MEKISPLISTKKHEITNLLQEFNEGKREALDAVIPIIYKELRRLAAHYLKNERIEHTLEPTALVHEAFLRLSNLKMKWQNRGHFFAMTAKLMRQILVDSAHSHSAEKRGGMAKQFSLQEIYAFTQEKPAQIIALHEALEELAKIDARRAQVVELRFFGGLNNEEIGQVLGVHSNTVLRDWTLARAWLKNQMQ